MTGTPAPRPPSAPLNLALTAGDETIAAAWDDPQDPGSPALEGWVFQWRESRPGVTVWSNTVVLLEDDESGGSHDLDMLTNDTPYDVQVAAFHNTAITAPASVTVTYESSPLRTREPFRCARPNLPLTATWWSRPRASATTPPARPRPARRSCRASPGTCA